MLNKKKREQAARVIEELQIIIDRADPSKDRRNLGRIKSAVMHLAVGEDEEFEFVLEDIEP